MPNSTLQVPTASSDYFGLAEWPLYTHSAEPPELPADPPIDITRYFELVRNGVLTPVDVNNVYTTNAANYKVYRFHCDNVPDAVKEGNVYYINLRFTGVTTGTPPRVRFDVWTDYPNNQTRMICASKRVSFALAGVHTTGGIAIPFTAPKPSPLELQKTSVVMVSELGGGSAHGGYNEP